MLARHKNKTVCELQISRRTDGFCWLGPKSISVLISGINKLEREAHVRRLTLGGKELNWRHEGDCKGGFLSLLALTGSA